MQGRGADLDCHSGTVPGAPVHMPRAPLPQQGSQVHSCERLSLNYGPRDGWQMYRGCFIAVDNGATASPPVVDWPVWILYCSKVEVLGYAVRTVLKHCWPVAAVTLKAQ